MLSGTHAPNSSDLTTRVPIHSTTGPCLAPGKGSRGRRYPWLDTERAAGRTTFWTRTQSGQGWTDLCPGCAPGPRHPALHAPTSPGPGTSSLVARALGSLCNERVSHRPSALIEAIRQRSADCIPSDAYLICAPSSAKNPDGHPRRHVRLTSCGFGCRRESVAYSRRSSPVSREPAGWAGGIRRSVNPSRKLRRLECFTCHPVHERPPDLRKRGHPVSERPLTSGTSLRGR